MSNYPEMPKPPKSLYESQQSIYELKYGVVNTEPLYTLDQVHAAIDADRADRANYEKLLELLKDAPKFFAPQHAFDGEKNEWFLKVKDSYPEVLQSSKD